MDDAKPDLTIVVVTHNARDLALATLKSARRHAGSISCEWIVVDSGSRDQTPSAIAKSWPEVRVIRRHNIGFGAANNVGLQFARGRYVLLLNPDVEILKGDLAGLVRALDVRPTVGAASVLQVNGNGELLPSVMRFPSVKRQLGEALLPSTLRRVTRLEELVRPGRAYLHELSGDWMSGAFLLVRAEAFQTVGGFDERFFLYSEETDLCRRMRDAGWEMRHLPLMTVAHYGGVSASPDLAAQLARSKLLYAYKHFGALRAGGLRAALAIAHALRAARAMVGARHDSDAVSRSRAALGAVLDPRWKSRAGHTLFAYRARTGPLATNALEQPDRADPNLGERA